MILRLLVLFLLLLATPAHATTNEVFARNEYTVAGNATVFGYTFKILDKVQITVMVNGIVKNLDTDYSVSGVGDSGGGSVTFATTPGNGNKVVLIRDQPIQQLSTYTANEAFPATRLMNDLDKNIMVDQMQQEEIGRALKFDPHSFFRNVFVDDPIAGQCLVWNASRTRVVSAPCQAGSGPGGPTGPVSGSGDAGQIAFWTAPTILAGDGKLLWDNANKFMTVGTLPLGPLKAGNIFAGLVGPMNSIGMQNLMLQTVQGDPSLIGLVTLGDDRVGLSSWNFRGTGATNPIYGANFGVVFNTPGVANGLEIDVQNDMPGVNYQGQALWLNGSTRAPGTPGTVGHRANAILIDTQDGSKWERGILFKEGFVANGATGSIEKMGIHFEHSQDADFIVIQPRLGTLGNVAMKLTNPEFTLNRFELLNSGAIRVGNTLTGPAFPSYAFVEDGTTGLYMEASRVLGFAISNEVPCPPSPPPPLPPVVPPCFAGARRMTLGTVAGPPAGPAGLNLWPWGSGANQGGSINFFDNTSVHSVGFMAPDFVGNSYRIKLPDVPGAAGQCVITDGGFPISNWSFAACGTGGGGGGGGNVTAGAVLGLNQVLLGDGGAAIKGIGSLGTVTTVLHGNAAGAPTWGPVMVVDLGATGTPSATTFLRGDNTWSALTPTFITKVPEASLPNSQALSSLASGLMFNTTGTGTISIYAGSTPCAAGNFISAISATGVATCGTPAGSGTVTNSGTLTINQIIIGAGTTAVAALGTQGTTSTVLHGNAGGPPTFGPVALATDVSGTLGAAQFPALTGDVTTPIGSLVTTLANNVVSNAKLADMDTARIKGRVTSGTSDPEDLTGTQVTTLLDVFTSGLKGLVPPSGGGTVNFLRADGAWAAAGGAGSVTAGGTLTLNQIVIGQGTSAIATLGTLGTTTQVLHGNAGGAPTFGPVALGADVSGRLPYVNLTAATVASRMLGRGSASAGDWQEISLGTGLTMTGTVLSAVAGGDVTGPASAIDSEVALFSGTTGKIIKRATGSGPARLTSGVLSAGNTNLASEVTGDLPLSNIVPATAAARLLGRGSASAGDWQEITLGTNLAFSGTVLNATGGGGGAPTTATYITQTPDGTLTNEQALSPLATGYMFSTTGTGVVSTQTVTEVTAALNIFTNTLKGLTPASGGGTVNFLRADGNWAAPGGGGNVTTGTLTTNALVLGSGATAVVSLSSLGTTTQVLHGNASGVPTWGPVEIVDINATGTPGSSTFLRGDGQWVTPPVGGTGTVTTSGSPLTNQLTFFTAPSVISGDVGLTWDNSAKQFTAGVVGTLTDLSSWTASNFRVTRDLTSNSNQFAMNIQTTVPTATGATANYEKASLIVMSQTNDPSTSFNLDMVGIDTRGIISGTNPLGRAWGLYADGTILPGGDGLVLAGEFAIHNNGSDQPNVDTTTSKYNLHITAAGPVTAGINFASPAPAWHKGIFARPASFFTGATDNFIELDGVFTIKPDGATKIGGGLTGITPSMLLGVGSNNAGTSALVRLESTNTAAAARTQLALARSTTGSMDDNFAARQDFILRDVDAVDNIAARFIARRSGDDGTGVFTLQTGISGVLGTRLEINQLGQFFYLPTPTTGTVGLLANSTRRTELQFYTNNNTTAVSLIAPATATSNHVWTLPTTLGAAGSILTNDGLGNLSWAASSGAVTTVGTPAVNQIAFFSGSTNTITSHPGMAFDPTPQWINLNAVQLRLQATGTSRMQFHLLGNNNTSSVGFQAPATAAGSILWTLPTTVGAAGSVLSNDGAGNLSWSTTSGSVTTTGTPAANQMTFMTGANTISSSPGFSFNSGTSVLSLVGPGSLHVGLTPFGGQAAGPLLATVSNSDNSLPYQALLGQIVNGSSAGIGSATVANDKVAVSGWAHRNTGGTSPIYGGNFTVQFFTPGVSVGLELGVINSSGSNGVGNGLWVNGIGSNHRDNAILIDTQDTTKWGAGIRFTEGNVGGGASGSTLNYGIIFDKSSDADFIVIRPRVGVNNVAFRITDSGFTSNKFAITNTGQLMMGNVVVPLPGEGSISTNGGINTTGNIGANQYFAQTQAGFTVTKVLGTCTLTFVGGILVGHTGPVSPTGC